MFAAGGKRGAPLMTGRKLVLTAAAALLAGALAGCGQGPDSDSRPVQKAAEITRSSAEIFGEHVVHFSTQSTTMLTPEVARAYGITRSENRAMLNVAVLHMGAPGGGTPVSATVTVEASNLLGQDKNIAMREVREGDAIYYIGEFAVSDEEIVNFNVVVRPEGTDASHELDFKQQFFTN
jgi:hypothetical protein